MIRIAVRNPALFSTMRKIPLLRYIVGYDMTAFDASVALPLQKEIFATFYVPDGTSRQTDSHRFDDLDEKTIHYIREQKRPIIHDIAVADGSTSASLLHKLKSENVAASFYISDKYSDIIIEYGSMGRVFRSDGTMIAAYCGGLIAERGIKVFFMGRWLYGMLNRAPTATSKKTICKLLAPEVMKCIQRGELIECEFDLFENPPHLQCSLIRCMNVLNNNYFTNKKISCALKNIMSTLSDNGILLLGRTMPNGKNNATFYRRTGNRMVAVEQTGSGYEASSLVTLTDATVGN